MVTKIKAKNNTRLQPLEQAAVDAVRARVMYTIKELCDRKGKPYPQTQHLWFNKGNINNYELRPGNAPSDSDRPLWLRGLELYIDLNNPEVVRIINEIEKDQVEQAKELQKKKQANRSTILAADGQTLLRDTIH